MKKATIISVLIWIAMVVTTILMYEELPSKIPNEYNLDGEIIGYISKVIVWVIPIICIFVFVVKGILIKIDPRKENVVHYKNSYDLIISVIIITLCAIQFVFLDAAKNSEIRANAIGIIISLLLIIIGNNLPKVKSNFFLGIKTPWTLSSDEVWFKVHRISGIVLVVIGVLTLIATLIMQSVNANSFIVIEVTALVLAFAVILVFGYSYLEYKKTLKN